MKLEKVIDGLWNYKGFVINKTPAQTKHKIYKNEKYITQRNNLQQSLEYIDKNIK